MEKLNSLLKYHRWISLVVGFFIAAVGVLCLCAFFMILSIPFIALGHLFVAAAILGGLGH
jgi:hypothetical protein